MGLGTYIQTHACSLEQAHARVQRAEDLGYDAAYVTHVAGRDALTVVATYAMRTSRIRVGTGVVPIYTRTPATMAQTAATIDDLSDGRMTLGLGVSHRPIIEGWHGQTIDRPVAEMREYVAIVRAILNGKTPPEGEKWRTSFQLAEVGPRPDLPIYVAALSAGMLRLAGEIADGVMMWLCAPQYIRDVAIPALREGRERAGKTLDGFDVVAWVPAGLAEDPAAIHDDLRPDMLPYFPLPFYRAMLERSGFGDEIAAYDAAAAASDEAGMRAAISERLIETITPLGDADAVRAGIGRYREAGVTTPCVAPISQVDFEATLEAAAGA